MVSRYRWSDWVCYWLLKWLVVNPLFRLVFWGRISGSLPRSGPLILVCNHASHLDPPLLANAARRPVAFMAKEELFRVPVLKQVITLYGAYPVRRGGADRKALQAAQQALGRGWAVGIFLNGTRSRDGRIETPHLGAALIAAQTQTALVPMALGGTERIQPKGQRFPRLFAPIRVFIGAPISPPTSTDREELHRVTARCVEAIHSLLEHQS